MHIPDGFLSPEVNTTTFIMSAAAAVIASRKAGILQHEKQIPLLGVSAAFIFAAQMLNFPVAGGTSGHFLGAALATILFGPWNGFLIMTVVLMLQCFIFADGGVTALGSNIFNMGIIGCFGSYYIFKSVDKFLTKTRFGYTPGIYIASWLSVLLASVFCSIELHFSGTIPLTLSLPAMVSVHAIIGIGEAIMTAASLSMIKSVRPDLFVENTVRLEGVRS